MNDHLRRAASKVRQRQYIRSGDETESRRQVAVKIAQVSGRYLINTNEVGIT